MFGLVVVMIVAAAAGLESGLPKQLPILIEAR
jgi:hypothetical protein